MTIDLKLESGEYNLILALIQGYIIKFPLSGRPKNLQFAKNIEKTILEKKEHRRVV